MLKREGGVSEVGALPPVPREKLVRSGFPWPSVMLIPLGSRVKTTSSGLRAGFSKKESR